MTNQFKPNLNSIRTHVVPQWYDDSKLGIFIHWGAYSVPAWAPVTYELGEIPCDDKWFTNNPYAEWYYNSINVGRGATYEYHKEKYGEKFPYENFTGMWKAENWQPSQWAELFRDSGAKYAVITTKHHDGFCLWPSEFTDYNTMKRGPQRDIVGELQRAVEREGLKFGTYYSGLIDWSFADDPIWEESDLFDRACPTFEYADYAYKQAMELIDRYKPSIFWNDIGWPVKGTDDLPYLFSHYYNTVKDGVVNDRWNDVWWDYKTLEYKFGNVDFTKKWEMVRGLGLSFGFNRNETTDVILSGGELVSLLIRTVADNGNLMINIGPRADGTIPEEQQSSLRAMGEWLGINGEAVYGTRCHDRRVEKLDSGETLSFTRKEKASYLTIEGCKGRVLLPGVKSIVGALDNRVKMIYESKMGGMDISFTHIPDESMPVVLKLS